MPITYLSGVTGFCQVGGVAYPFGKWKATIKTKMIPNRNFLTAPFDAWVAGFTGATLDMEMPVYPAGTLPASIGAGTAYTFTLGYATSISLSVTAIVESIEPSNDADGSPILRVTAVSQGSFTAAVN